MMSEHRWAAGACLAALSFATTANAQSNPAAPPAVDGSTTVQVPAQSPPETNEVADIVVTAQKRSQNLNDVPMSITAITGETLQNRGITNVQDLVKLTPGLSYAESGNGVPVYSLRGVGFFDTSLGARPTVSIYVDEAPLPFTIMTSGASFDLDRVEVLKGPQGTLFGQNATGGAINYIAAKPKSSPGAGMTASFARFATADWQGYITGPLASGLNARLAVRTVQGGGWQKSYTRSATLGDQNFTQGRFLLDWDGLDRLKVSLNVNGFVDKGDTQAGQLVQVVPQVASQIRAIPALLAYPTAPHNDRAADWDPGAPLRKDNRFYQATLRADYDLTDRVTLTSLSAYSHMRIRQLVDIDGTALTNAIDDISGTLSSLSTEARLTGRFGGLTLIVGGNYSHDKSDENDIFFVPYSTLAQITLPVAPYNSPAPSGSQNFHTKAVFGNIDYDIGRLVTLHGGIRYTKADLDYSTCSRAGNADTGAGIVTIFNRIRNAAGLPSLGPIPQFACAALDANLTLNPLTGSFNQDNISWRAGVDLKPAERVLIYFNVSRGYKAGSIPVTAGVSYEQARPVGQETVLAYEAGFKVSVFDRLADVTGAVFSYRYGDKQLKGRVQTTPNILGPLESLVNVPRSRVNGAEAQIIVYPAHGLSLSAAGTYLDTKVTGPFLNYTVLATLRDFNGNPFPYSPKWQVNLDANYKFPLSSALNASLGANYSHRSKTSAGFGNEPLLEIDAYGLLDLQAGIESRDGKWRASVFGRNVTNTYYWTNVAKFFDDVRRLAGQPATYGVQVGLKF
ncbi:TonB-dependent receptor (plasmid) [Sphingomonas panacis]|uniref:TonB-dependent receptor n=1 Tax=Sphingomonas panacis TaxID=1560345 RepID=A0A1B3ZIC2_9SPHN|nr:TonB-dependent receptor [Sphingomonas panacis]AOH87167.1 TonB-dependent receptor [Sphingomonas panacis]